MFKKSSRYTKDFLKSENYNVWVGKYTEWDYWQIKHCRKTDQWTWRHSNSNIFKWNKEENNNLRRRKTGHQWSHVTKQSQTAWYMFYQW